MGAETDPTTDHDSAADIGHGLSAPRTTAPMSEYGSREVGYGLAFLVVGLTIAYVFPLLVSQL